MFCCSVQLRGGVYTCSLKCPGAVATARITRCVYRRSGRRTYVTAESTRTLRVRVELRCGRASCASKVSVFKCCCNATGALVARCVPGGTYACRFRIVARCAIFFFRKFSRQPYDFCSGGFHRVDGFPSRCVCVATGLLHLPIDAVMVSRLGTEIVNLHRPNDWAPGSKEIIASVEPSRFASLELFVSVVHGVSPRVLVIFYSAATVAIVG